MLVKDLIQLLKSKPQNWDVKIEGCDCISDVKDVQIFSQFYTLPTKEKFVIITREEES